MTEPDYQAILDQAAASATTATTTPARARRMLQAIGVAFSDALGSHGQQPELRSRWEHERDKGRRLQVNGHIDLATLERVVAGRVLDIVRDHLADPHGIARVISQHTSQPESWRCLCGERGITDHALHLAWVLRERFTIPQETFDDL